MILIRSSAFRGNNGGVVDKGPAETGGGSARSGLIGVGILAVIAVVAVGAFIVFQSGSGAETTTTLAAAAAPTTTVATPTTATEAVTTTTVTPTTATTEPEDDPNPFVGWWAATDVDGSFLDLRVDADGGFMYWDSASGICAANGLGHSPQTWAGTATFVLDELPTMTATGIRECFPYGDNNGDLGEAAADFVYDLETDMLEFVLDGVRYTRAPLLSPSTDPNPFVGVWEATDSDGTRVTMKIDGVGTWQSRDTRSGGCENMGLTYATWSAEGTGMFDLQGIPSFAVQTTTFCHPVDGEAVPRSEDVVLTYEYRPESDEVALVLFLETIFTRVP